MLSLVPALIDCFGHLDTQTCGAIASAGVLRQEGDGKGYSKSQGPQGRQGRQGPQEPQGRQGHQGRQDQMQSREGLEGVAGR